MPPLAKTRLGSRPDAAVANRALQLKAVGLGPRSQLKSGLTQNTGRAAGLALLRLESLAKQGSFAKLGPFVCI
jgi:hypothetical protein